MAAACAVIAGAAEAGIAAFKQVVLDRIIFLSHDYVWMTPASFLLLVVPVTLVVHALLKAARRPLALSTVLGLLTAVLLFSMLIPYGALAWWASGCLAAGVGWQVALRAGTGRRELWLTPLRRVAVVLAAIMAFTGVTVVLSGRGTCDRRPRHFPPRRRRPQRTAYRARYCAGSNLGLYGYSRPTTPELQKLAAESTVFDRAIATAPWTLPSHSSLFTGRAAGALGVDWLVPLSETPQTLAEVLRNRGYATGGFAANQRYTSYGVGARPRLRAL